MLRWIVLLCLVLLATPVCAGALRIAVDDFPPYSLWHNGIPQGSDVELAKRFCTALGLKPSFQRCTRSECLAMLRKGKADVMFGIKRRPSRDEYLRFSGQPLRIHNDTLFWVRKGSGTRLDRHTDLYGKTVGVIKGYALSPRFDNDPRIERFPQADPVKLFKLLMAGTVNIVALDRERGRAALAKTDFAKWIEPAPYSLTSPDPELLAISRKSPLVHEPDLVDKALRQAVPKNISSADDI